MDIFWQNFIIIFAMIGASLYLVYNFTVGKKKKPSCSNCPAVKAMGQRKPVRK